MRIPIALIACVLSGAAAAQGSDGAEATPGDERPRSAEAAARYPQAVRVGDLVGRQVIEDSQQQRVLGRINGVVRGGDGRPSILMDHGGLLGFGTRRVAVPAEAMALLGQLVVLKDVEAARLSALPEISAPPSAPLPADATIRMGLARN